MTEEQKNLLKRQNDYINLLLEGINEGHITKYIDEGNLKMLNDIKDDINKQYNQILEKDVQKIL